MLRILMGITLGASATSGLGLQIVMGAIGLGLIAWGFHSMYINGQFDER